ncbi:MAG: aminoglycoside phosphotransferase family protein, partial [Anaerolineales bacterium]|nr:aminoglycoside phosphotransferase family protein [Anaerolineales bacterium]
MNKAWQATEQFVLAGEIEDIRAYGDGNINDTYLITLNLEECFILQRINTYVFKQPKLITANIRTFTEHVRGKLNQESDDPRRRWDVPSILSTHQGDDFFIDPEGNFWRASSFVKNARSYGTVQNESHAWEVGYALGRFQSLLSDLDPKKLHDTLVGFHIIPKYLRAYDEVMTQNPPAKSESDVRFCHRMIAERRGWSSILEDAKDQGLLQIRIMHGDPKVDNIMICDEIGQAISIIDLDTVKPGLVQYDIGDCLRSSCNPLGETPNNIDDVRFETDLAQAILEGYISVANEFLTPNDYAFIYDSIRLLTFELGLRFFAD